MYKAASQGLQRAARASVTTNGINPIDPEMLRSTSEKEASYAELCNEKRRLEYNISEINRNLDRYKSSALSARYHIDNAHYKKLVAERSRLSRQITDLASEMLTAKNELKVLRKVVGAQRANVYDEFFKQAARLILAREVYDKVCELADTLATAVEDRARGDQP